jgi:hypothetical protein
MYKSTKMTIAVMVCHFAVTLATPARTTRETQKCEGLRKGKCAQFDHCEIKRVQVDDAMKKKCVERDLTEELKPLVMEGMCFRQITTSRYLALFQPAADNSLLTRACSSICLFVSFSE